MANQFHYYRLTDDDRILWGGYDAVYHWNNGVGPAHERRDATYSILAQQFFEMFPQLEGLRFSHRVGAARSTPAAASASSSARRSTASSAYAAGYTGLGVGATRWGARVCLDLVTARDGPDPASLVRKKPLPFPPEPLRCAGVWLTRRALARADRRQGRRGPWLKLLDASASASIAEP